MNLALAQPAANTCARAGSGELAVEMVSGQSAVTTARANNPLKLLTPRPRGQSAWAYLSNFGGGLLPGDELDFQISVGPEARCFLGTQSSTRIYRSGPKGAVKNILNANIQIGGLLVYAPDVSQAFANSRYIQKQSFHLADESAGLIFLDWYSSGRSARGERWVFSEYTSRNEIRIGGKLVFLDSVRLSADDELIDLPSRMGRMNCVATLVLIGAPFSEHASALLQQIASLPVQKRSNTTVVGSAIPNGAVLRFAGVSVEQVAAEVFPRLNFAAALLGDDLFQRKW
jgi:urease accessory protein